MTISAGEVFTNEPSTYGLISYGENLYGVTANPVTVQPVIADWVIEPFVAQSLNYGAVGVSWSKPHGVPVRWRLLSNRYGYPVDQEDGQILIDSPEWIGSFFLDTSVIPGQYQYYGIYAQTDAVTDTWVRAGTTGCLAVANADSAEWLADHLPAFFTGYQGTSLTQDAAGNPYFQQFLDVLGWGLDYVQTQYDMLARHLNDPMAVPVNDLVNLATQLGLPFDPMISIYLMRKAAANWAHVAQERGTPLGIVNQLSLLTGFGVDLQSGPNLMLEQDQSVFPDPSYPAWNSSTSYKAGEIVTHGSYLYSCLVAGTVGTAPPSGASSNTDWQLVQDAVEPTGLLANPVTAGVTGTYDGVNTWEVLYPLLTNGLGPLQSLTEGIGEPSPSALTVWQTNTLKMRNQTASATDMAIRSVSRSAADKATTTTSPFPPDQFQGINDGIPVPFTLPNQLWNATVRYGTGDIVVYNNQPYQALRASTGATPPSFTSEWVALSPNSRLRLMVAAQISQNLTTGTNFTVPVTPFVEWYDQHGKFITRVTARTTQTTPPYGNGTAGIPSNLALDSFARSPGTGIGGRTMDNAYANTWVAQDSNWTVSPFGGGVAFPQTAGTRSAALVTGPVSGQVGVTLVTFAGQGSQAANANPYFSGGIVDPWTGWGANLTATTVRPSGSGYPNAAMAVPDSPAALTCGMIQDFPVVHGQSYSCSVMGYVQASDINSFHMQVDWYNGSTFLSSSTVDLSPTLNGWATYAMNNITAPSTATQCHFYMYGYNTGSTALAASDVVFMTAATMTPNVTSAQNQGLVFRWVDENDYWKVTPTQLVQKKSGTFQTPVTLSTAAQPGDRLVVSMNGTAIQVFLNGNSTPVATATDSTSYGATVQHGMIVE